MTTSLGITRISLSCSTSDDAAHTVCRHTDTEHRGPGGHRGEWQRERQDYAAISPTSGIRRRGRPSSSPRVKAEALAIA